MISTTLTTSVWTCLLASLSITSSVAFLSDTTRFASSSQTRTRSATRLLATRYDSGGDYWRGSPDDEVEQLRQRLEHLVEESSSIASPPPPSQHHHAPHNNNQNPSTPTPPESSSSSSSSAFNLFDLFFGGSSSKSGEPQTHTSSNTNAVDPSALQINLSVLDQPLRRYLSDNKKIKTTRSNPMTFTELQRRKAEIQLLEQLEDENGPVLDSLWKLWFLEGGLLGAIRLQEVEYLMSQHNTGNTADKHPQNPNNYDENNHLEGSQQHDGPGLDPSWEDQAEQILLELIQEHRLTWAEPISRLATLYYMQGKLEDAKQLCHIVLKIKPWHFGTLSNLVMVYASLHQTELAQQMAPKRLPALHQTDPRKNRRRRAWVQTAMEQASRQLNDKLQERREWWGPADSYHDDTHTLPTFAELHQMMSTTTIPDTPLGSADSDENAWQ